MERIGTRGILLVALLAVGMVAGFPRAAAQPGAGEGALPEVSSAGGYVKVTTENFTVIFPGNQTKPFFVWWENSDPSKVYVVHFKGLYEYAVVDGSGFTLTNLAEGALWQRLIQEANARDLAKAGEVPKGLSYAFEAHSRVILAAGKAALFKSDTSDLRKVLLEAMGRLESLRGAVSDPEILQQIDSAKGAVGAAVDAIDSGAKKGTIQNAISAAMRECQRLTQMIAQKSKSAIGSAAEDRVRLEGIADGFHPALLAFSGCRWEMSEVREIAADQGGDPIGISFNLTLAEAPSKFDFAEGNVVLVVRVYGSDVLESVSVNDTYSYTYNVGAGEMKIDLVVKGWEWNFDPKTVKLLNSTSVTVSPALALWVDLSSFTVENVTDDLFGDLDCVRAQARLGNITFSTDGSATSIDVNGQDQDARAIGFQHRLLHRFLAGKVMKFAAPAKVWLDTDDGEEKTLGGFFRFVPQAVVTDASGEREAADVTAAYMSAGNHVKLYLCYPYFNGTLIHDPSIGVEAQTQAQAQNPTFLVTLGPSGTGVASVQEVPSTPSWGEPPELFLAGVAVLAGAAALLIFVRRHPAYV